MKYGLLILMIATLASCSTVKINSDQAYPASDRAPAQASTCSEIIKKFFADKPEKTLEQILVERKLITFSEKKAQIHYPRLEWINKVKKYFNTSLRNWNNNRYPAFYLFNQEEILPSAKRYAENLEKILADNVSIDDDETTKAYVNVSNWIKSFKNYQTELDQLIEERISLQYNISLLKKLKLDSDKPRDIIISIKRGGKLQNEVITLRKEDANLKATINKLKLEMKALDGSFSTNGRIKDRIIRQAMLFDMLTILHREVEHSIKNTSAPGQEILDQLKSLSILIKDSKLSPSTYGVYKIQDKIFIRELIATSKLDVAYEKIKDPLNKIKTILSDYFKNKNSGTDKEKVGFLKRIYAKITSITPKQAAIGGGSTVIAGISLERYFAFNGHPSEEEISRSNIEPEVVDLEHESESIETSHEQQIKTTKQVETQKHEDHSSVVEIHIDELTN